MPTRTKAKTASVKKTAKKPLRAVKKKTGALHKAAAKKVTASKPAHKTGFMWKLLEQKREEQKQKDTQAKANPFDRVSGHQNIHGFGRFNGPRRRVG
jgi:hypothetical protein